MIKRTGSKGGIFLSMFIMLAIYLFSIALVVIFFYFFKFHITITMIDEYRWNKIQEVPMSLLSMYEAGELFVTKMNKVIYGFEPKAVIDGIKNDINNQLYLVFGGIPPTNIGYIISVDTITVSESPFPDCECKPTLVMGSLLPTCKGGCGDKEDDLCGTPIGVNQWDYDQSKCFNIGRVEYSGSYPFPLTFNGTDKFTASMSYHAVEYK